MAANGHQRLRQGEMLQDKRTSESLLRQFVGDGALTLHDGGIRQVDRPQHAKLFAQASQTGDIPAIQRSFDLHFLENLFDVGCDLCLQSSGRFNGNGLAAVLGILRILDNRSVCLCKQIPILSLGIQRLGAVRHNQAGVTLYHTERTLILLKNGRCRIRHLECDGTDLRE